MLLKKRVDSDIFFNKVSIGIHFLNGQFEISKAKASDFVDNYEEMFPCYS